MSTRNASGARRTTPIIPSEIADYAQGAPEIQAAETLTSQTFELTDQPEQSEKVDDSGERLTPAEFVLSLTAVVATEADMQAWLSTATLQELKDVGDLVKDSEQKREKFANQLSQTRKRRGLAADSECSAGKQVKMGKSGLSEAKIPAKKETDETPADTTPAETTPVLTGMAALLAALNGLDTPDLDLVIAHANKLKALAIAKADLGL